MITLKSTMPRQPRIALSLIVAIGMMVVFQFAYSLFHQFADIPLGNSPFDLVEAVSVDLGNHYLSETFLAFFVVFPLGIMFRQLLHQTKLSRKWNTYFINNRDVKTTQYLNKKYKQEGIRIEVVFNKKMIAATVGGWKPKVILSTTTIENFTADELEAILFHEMYHYKYRHPLQLFILTVTAESLAFLPVIKSLVRHYKVWTELLADRYAISRMGSEVQLAQVLLKILNSNSESMKSYAVHFTDEAVNYRLKQLIDPQAHIKIPFCELRTLFSSLTVLAVMMFILLLGCMET